VPGHWRFEPAFADSDGPVMYRADLHHDLTRRRERVFVVFDGVFYQADVWLDGAYLGDPEGYFFPTRSTSPISRLGDDHVLAVEVSCPAQPVTGLEAQLTGALQDGLGVRPDGGTRAGCGDRCGSR
jgi:beta-mannosidase